MERKVIIDGKEYTLYEKAPNVAPDFDTYTNRALRLEMRRREKKSREQDWKQRARKGYHKK